MIQLYMLDTNTVSFILSRKSPAAQTKARSLSLSSTLCISTITEGELFFGLAKAGGGTRESALELFLTTVKVYPWNTKAARAYGTLRAMQEAAGSPLQPLDTQIAAHAIALGATLVTHDKRSATSMASARKIGPPTAKSSARRFGS